jgi:hypothetical protein
MPVVEGSPNWKGRPVDPPAGGGDDGGMEARIDKLEQIAEKTSDRLAAIERDLAVIKSNYATKEDMHKEFGALQWKLFGVVVLAQLIPAIPAVLKALHLVG